MQKKRWVIKKTDEIITDELYQDLRINRTLCKLLIQRNVTTFEQAKHFFRPSLDQLHDPFLMKDMDKAVERIHSAIINKEKILIYGDYDVDGTTSIALVYSYLSTIYYNSVDYYVPNRFTEGYGISTQGIDWAKENGFSLIIALDCGIKSMEKIEYAKGFDIDFIICDHHLPEDKLPNAVAVLDPKRLDCPYPYKELSGCGIGFKLLQAFAISSQLPIEDLYEYLDLVAISIAADIVPLTGENRVLAHYGLQKLNAKPRPGIRQLIGEKREISVSDVVFVIAPRINAAGRIDDARKAVRLLTSQGMQSAITNANHLQDDNDIRKQLDTDITLKALQMIETDPNLIKQKTTVLYNAEWSKGVIGIVASRLLDKYFRPTIILTKSQELIAGSARSVPEYDIYEALKSCSHLLEQFGGHKYAAGLTLKPENLHAFTTLFEEIVQNTIDDDLLIPEINIDSELPLEYIHDSESALKFYNILKQFAPFGPENMKPVFVSYNLIDTGRSAIVGNGKHLKISAKTEGSNTNVKGIAYNMAHKYADIANQKFDVCYTIELNHYNGVYSLQMNVRDIRTAQN